MAAAMNGMALHGGIMPYGGTFLVFTDYCRPAIRLSALMGQRVIYVMTHDSIGLGEDGPTHQPVEHLAACAPCRTSTCSARPTRWRRRSAGSWRCRRRRRPSILALTRQARAGAAHGGRRARTCRAKGAYVLAEASGGKRDVTLLATGSEVSLAMEARELLAKDGVQRRSGVDAVLGAVRGPARELSQGGARRGAARRRRGGGRHGLGALARRRAAPSSA